MYVLQGPPGPVGQPGLAGEKGMHGLPGRSGQPGETIMRFLVKAFKLSKFNFFLSSCPSSSLLRNELQVN